MNFNITPIIDIVFLLIIFLVVVFGRIDAENFDVQVPDKCANSIEQKENPAQIATVSITRENGEVVFAVGAEKNTAEQVQSEWIKEKIDYQLAKAVRKDKTVSLRIDKSITFKEAVKALEGAAESGADGIRLATVRENSTYKPVD